MFISYLQSNPAFYITWIVLMTFSICLHEYAHAYTALMQGDSTAADAGHLSLNPVRQMGWVSLVMMCVIGIVWGRVPVNPQRFRHRYSNALVAAAGPCVNAALFLGFSALCVPFALGWTPVPDMGGFFLTALQIGAMLNVALFLFNMLPIPILDGWAVFTFLVPGLKRVSQDLRNGLTFIVFMLFFMTGLFGAFLGIGMRATRAAVTLMSLPFG